MSILVTGSSGFVGRYVMEALAERGAAPVGFDVLPPRHPLPEGVPFVQGNTVNIEDIMAAIKEHKVDCIIALGFIMAALDAPGYEDFTGAVKVNCLGIANAFEAARLLGLGRVIFASSVAVYGRFDSYKDGELITEDSALQPRNLYGKMKVMDEELARRYRLRHGLETVTVRPQVLLGSGNTMFPERIVSQPVVGKPSHMAFPSRRHQNAVAVRDLADLYALIATAPKVQHDCYLASGNTFTWGEVADIVRKYVPEAQITFDEGATPVELGLVYQCDNSRAVNEFGWQLHSLDDTVHLNINDARRDAGLPSV